MAAKCALEHVSVCGEYLPKADDNYYNAKVLASTKVTNLFPNLLNDTFFANFSERWLIEHRSGIQLQDNDSVCAKHRYSFGEKWRPLKRCYHPEHLHNTPLPKKMKVTGLRPSSSHQFKTISKLDPTFLLFAPICRQHGKTQDVPVEIDEIDTRDDASFEPSSELKMLNSVLNLLGVTNVRDIVDIPVTNLSKKLLDSKRQKFNCAVDKLRDLFAAIAPGQESELKNLLFLEEDDSLRKKGELEAFCKVYNAEDSDKGKLKVLSHIDQERFSRKEIQEQLGCSRSRISKARRMVAEGDSFNTDTTSGSKKRLDIGKCKHFLTWLYESGSLGDLAYGTTAVRYSSGYKTHIPKPILTGLRTHAISNYLEFCQHTNTEALSRTSLFKVIKLLKPSQRHSLAGLDNHMVAGTEGLETLKRLCEQLFENDKDIQVDLTGVQRYLKGSFVSNCCKNSKAASHCTAFGLSDPKNDCFTQQCDHEHSEVCDSCAKMFQLFEIISDKIDALKDPNTKAEMTYDYEHSKKAVLKWQQHILRHVQQNQAKLDAFAEIQTSHSKAVWIRDWGQKVLPMKYREEQSSYFGKKGMSIHFDVFIFNDFNTGNLNKAVFVTLLDNCKQNAVETLALIPGILSKFRSLYPQVCSLYIRMDNAGCYSANGVAESTFQLCKQSGITLVRLDHNEPQKGKDQCDREAAVCKSYIRAYVNASNNATTAADLKKGIMFQGGPRNTYVGVLKVRSSSMSGVKNKEGIQAVHSILFAFPNMIFWRYYDIGIGVKHKMHNVDIKFDVDVISPYEKTANSQIGLGTPCSSKSQTNDDSKLSSISENSTSDAIYNFASNLIMSSEIRLENESDPATTESNCIDATEEFLAYFKKGWGVGARECARFDVRVKQFMLELFSLGEKTGKKVCPEDAHKAMRSKKDPCTGMKEFAPKTYMSVEQIKSLFARFSTLYRQSKLELCDISEGSSLMNVEEHHEYNLAQQEEEGADFLANTIDKLNEEYDEWLDDDNDSDE